MHLILSADTASHYNQRLDDRLRSFRPNPKAEKSVAKSVLDSIKTDLQQNLPPFERADFKLAGSLNKDTMLTSRKEIDVIISFPMNLDDFPPNETTRRHFIDLLATYYDVEPRDPKYFNLIIEKSGFKVDLLPTFKISIEDFLSLDPKERYCFKPHMSLFHIEFITDNGKKFQDFCRIVKYWGHGPSIKERNKYASSFFLEIVASEIWRISSDWSFIQLFEAFLRRMKNILYKRSSVAKFFGSSKYYDCLEIRGDGLPELTVLDPVDPADNIYTKGPQNTQLSQLRNRARETLKLWKNQNFQDVFDMYFSRDPV